MRLVDFYKRDIIFLIRAIAAPLQENIFPSSREGHWSNKVAISKQDRPSVKQHVSSGRAVFASGFLFLNPS
jgi:hypothetical protein